MGRPGAEFKAEFQPPLKCDLIHEIQILRQLISQESLLRINTNVRLQELEKIVTNIHQNTEQNNAFIEENNNCNEENGYHNLFSTDKVERSVKRAETVITAEQNTKRGTRQTLIKLEQGMISLNQT